MTDFLADHSGVGTIIEIAVTLAGLAGGWATMKVMQKVTLEKLSELKQTVDKDRDKNGENHDQNVDRMRQIELKIANECLKRDDFRDFERRFNERMDKVDHSVGNAATKAAGIIMDMMKAGGLMRGARD